MNGVDQEFFAKERSDLGVPSRAAGSSPTSLWFHF
jgi:hypothetical protein